MNTASLQPTEELEKFYETRDPWSYESTADDQKRLEMLLAHLPDVAFERTLDIGCGNGFVTAHLPGKQVVGVDISENALRWASQRCSDSRFCFFKSGVLELDSKQLGSFDLVILTGILYPQYIGSANALAKLHIDQVLRPGGILVHVHIAEWFRTGFEYCMVIVSSTHIESIGTFLRHTLNDFRVS